MFVKLFKKDFIYFTFRERGKEGKKEKGAMCQRNTYRLPLAHPQPGTWPATQACALTGN